MAERKTVDRDKFNRKALLPYELRLEDFALAMQDVYDFLFDVNELLVSKGLARMDDMLRPANMSGMLSDMLTASLAKHSRALIENSHFNGHPDLIVRGIYPNNSVKAGTEGIEIKSTRKPGGAVDTHGARDQWMCSFVYQIDSETEPARERKPMTFTEVYLGHVTEADFRNNSRGRLGTRTSTLHKQGITKLRQNWVYRLELQASAKARSSSVQSEKPLTSNAARTVRPKKRLQASGGKRGVTGRGRGGGCRA
ncbi:MAG TPA: hypothetical protein VMF50_13685 [Candidatus Binataceae bacterium]|nr:hypothetical protein [Candidatus Binataceae bacterium]